MSTTVNGSTGITFPDGTTQNTVSLPGMRNRIINGDFRIDQRNAGASATLTAGDAYYLDRWNALEDTDGTMTIRQIDGLDSTASNYEAGGAPSGFKNSMKFTVTSADTSIGATQSCLFRQMVEGLNVLDLGWGTASAQTVTLSFWVKSSVTGTFGGSLTNSAQNRCYPYTYVINAANTWEQKTITIAGDTTGTWLVTNGRGIVVYFSLAMGSTYSGTAGAWSGTSNLLSATGATNLMATNGATFYITGVQLEKGSTATPFEYRPYGQELALCQRYYYQVGNAQYAILGVGWAQTSTLASAVTQFPVTMRATPTFSYGGSAIMALYTNGITGYWSSVQAMTNYQSSNAFGWQGTTSGLTAGQVVAARANDASSNVQFSAEL